MPTRTKPDISMQPNVVGFIFARGGSKGLPRKNIAPLAGKPLIAHAIEAARSGKWIKRVVVSTDDREIAAVARRYGAEVPFLRPAELATDTAPEALAWVHALDYVDRCSRRPVDVFVSVPATAPLRLASDVDACVEALLTSDVDLAVTVSESRRNPYFSMLKIIADGTARVVMEHDQAVFHRQDAPTTYDIVPAAYAARPAFVRRGVSVLKGRMKAVPIPNERAVDIDDDLDLQIAELLLRRRNPLPAARELTAARFSWTSWMTKCRQSVQRAFQADRPAPSTLHTAT